MRRCAAHTRSADFQDCNTAGKGKKKGESDLGELATNAKKAMKEKITDHYCYYYHYHY